MSDQIVCPECGASSEENWVIEKRVLFWNVRITNPLGLKLFNYIDKIPLSISAATVRKILEKLGVLKYVPVEMIKPVYIPDIGDAWLCFNCKFKKFKFGN